MPQKFKGVMRGKHLFLYLLVSVQVFGQWQAGIENSELEFTATKTNFNLAEPDDFLGIETVTEFDVFNLLSYRNSMYEIHSWWPLLDIKGMNLEKLKVLQESFYLDSKNNSHSKNNFSIGYQTQTKSFSKDFWNRGERWFSSSRISKNTEMALTLERDFREKWIINHHINHLTGYLNFHPKSKKIHQITLGSFLISQGLGLTFSNGFAMKKQYSPFQSLRLKNQIRPYNGFMEQSAIYGIGVSGTFLSGDFNFYYGLRNLNAQKENGDFQSLSSTTSIYTLDAQKRFKNYTQNVLGFNFSKATRGYVWTVGQVYLYSPALEKTPNYGREIRSFISFHKKWKSTYFQYEAAVNQDLKFAQTLQSLTVMGGNHYLGFSLSKTPSQWNIYPTTELNLFNKMGGTSLQWSMENQFSFGKIVSNFRMGKSNVNLESLTQREVKSFDISLSKRLGKYDFTGQWSQSEGNRFRIFMGRTFDHLVVRGNYITGGNDFLKNHYTGIYLEKRNKSSSYGAAFGVFNANKQSLYRPVKTILSGFPFSSISGRGTEIQVWLKAKIRKIEVGILSHYTLYATKPNGLNIQFSIVYR